MAILFISDLHLCDDQPQISQWFEIFIHDYAASAEAVYILGDLFEAWLGDDFILPEYQRNIEHLQRLTQSGIPVYFIHGNRDFLIGEEFSQLSGCQLLDDPSIIDLYGTPTLLMHGDILCTDDTEHQAFRKIVRTEQWQQEFLKKSPQQRLAIAREYREISKEATSKKAAEIMDVTQQAVDDIMDEHNVYQIIHGHTHRCNIHEQQLNGRQSKRIVLDAWHEHGNMLECDENGCKMRNFV